MGPGSIEVLAAGAKVFRALGLLGLGDNAHMLLCAYTHVSIHFHTSSDMCVSHICEYIYIYIHTCV